MVVPAIIIRQHLPRTEPFSSPSEKPATRKRRGLFYLLPARSYSPTEPHVLQLSP
ncbi:hypothetical protein SAMN05444680_11952 [Variovorax sp. YR216]|nr:hypothetical protein SAMN05444680_11952 [Variovorax sp. YR216]